MDELRSAALQALRADSVEARLQLTQALAADRRGCDVDVILDAPGDVPGRPPRPILVAPGEVPARSTASPEGRAALLHALAHIEFNAIGLALDHVWRFAGLPDAYYRDWSVVAVEEAQHFRLLHGRLKESGCDYGDLPAHDGLWDMARKTADDVLARMALVPRTLEARALDASPAVRAKFAAAGDLASAQVIDVILRDEIGHVAIGNRWFRYLCKQRGVEATDFARQAARQLGVPRPRGPLNRAARLQAGFTAQEIDDLQGRPG